MPRGVENEVYRGKKKFDWKLLDVPNTLFSLIFPLLKTAYDLRLLVRDHNNREGVKYWVEKNNELKKKAHADGLDDQWEMRDIWDRELIKKGSGHVGACVGAGLGIAICSPGGLMPYINSDYGKLSDAFRQDFSKLGDGSAWDKFTSQALKDDFLNVLLCVLFIAACTVAGKVLFMGVRAGFYNSNLYEEHEALRIGAAEVLDEAVSSNSVKFFSAIERKLTQYCTSGQESQDYTSDQGSHANAPFLNSQDSHSSAEGWHNSQGILNNGLDDSSFIEKEGHRTTAYNQS